MKNFIKILILVCFAHYISIMAMEQPINQSADGEENLIDVLPVELWVIILSNVYFDENADDRCKNIYEAWDLIRQKLSAIFNTRLVCKRFNLLSNSISTRSSLKDELKEFYRPLFVKLSKNLKDSDFGKFIITGKDYGIIPKIISNRSKLGFPVIEMNNIIALLLFYGANVNYNDNAGNRDIHLVTMHFFQNSNLAKEMIEMLLAHGTDINIRVYEGNTALHVAVDYYNSFNNCEAKRCMVEMIKILLAHGADVNIQNNGYDTPMTFAERKSSSNEVRKLLRSADKSWDCILM